MICSSNRFFLVLLPVVASGLLTAGACSIGGPSKPLHYYSLDSGDVSESNSTSDSSSGAGILVEPFRAPDVYRDASIIWRNRRHMQRFRFNRWASSPPELIRHFFADVLRRNAGAPVGWVSTSDQKKPEARFFVRGTLRDLYLTESSDGASWKAVVRARVKLLMRPYPDRADDPNPIRHSGDDSQRVLAAWTLNASGITDAPSGEAATPDAMNALLENLAENLRDSGEGITASIRSEIREVRKQRRNSSTTKEEEEGQ